MYYYGGESCLSGGYPQEIRWVNTLLELSFKKRLHDNASNTWHKAIHYYRRTAVVELRGLDGRSDTILCLYESFSSPLDIFSIHSNQQVVTSGFETA